MKVVVEKKSL